MHTPAPWAYIPPDRSCGNDIPIYALAGRNRLFIARAYGPGNLTRYNPEAESNARLIAAAPELLAAVALAANQAATLVRLSISQAEAAAYRADEAHFRALVARAS